MKSEMHGTVSVLISFIPWIAYWVLCGMGHALGTVIALLLSMVILVPQLQRREFNFMDVVSIFYFSVATLLVYAFHIKTFIEMAGFLGYTALFLMAISSLVIK